MQEQDQMQEADQTQGPDQTQEPDQIQEPDQTQQQDQQSEQELELSGSGEMDTSLNIRLSIYKAYFQDLNLLGHTQSEGMYRFSDLDYHAWHAQNLWLEVAYRYGIPAGILFVIMTVWLLICHIRRLKQSPDLSRAVIPLLVCLVFFGYGTMELVWNVGQYILVLFFIVQHPGFYCSHLRCKQ